MTRPLNVIFLPSWYPVQNAPLNGVFNRELAELISEIHQVRLLHVGFAPVEKIQETTVEVNPNFRETVILIPEKGNSLIRQWRYFRSFFSWMKRTRKNWYPDLIHAQVAWKMGLPALLCRWRYGYPVLLTEHYTGYLPEDGALKGWKKNVSYFILRNVNRVTTVAPRLEEVLRKHRVKRVQTVFNRIHPVFFATTIVDHSPGDPFRFIHVSNFDDRQKQTSAIIEAFDHIRAKAAEQGKNLSLVLVVPGDKLNDYYQNNPHIGREGIVHIEPGINRADYANQLLNSDVLISFSNYETFGLTIAEAICCGLPVVYTECGGPEYFVEPRMGVKLHPGDRNALEDALWSVVENYPFDRPEIARVARAIFDNNNLLLEYSKLYQNLVK